MHQRTREARPVEQVARGLLGGPPATALGRLRSGHRAQRPACCATPCAAWHAPFSRRHTRRRTPPLPPGQRGDHRCARSHHLSTSRARLCARCALGSFSLLWRCQPWLVAPASLSTTRRTSPRRVPHREWPVWRVERRRRRGNPRREEPESRQSGTLCTRHGAARDLAVRMLPACVARPGRVAGVEPHHSPRNGAASGAGGLPLPLHSSPHTPHHPTSLTDTPTARYLLLRPDAALFRGRGEAVWRRSRRFPRCRRPRL